MRRFDPLTYRAPRTLEQAFGPYARGSLTSGERRGALWRFDPQDRPVVLVCGVGLGAILCALYLGVL